MKFIALSPFLLIGVIVGLVVHQLFPKFPLGKFGSIILGIFGAFWGIFLQDILDWVFIGNYTSAALAAFAGASFVTLLVSIFLRTK